MKKIILASACILALASPAAFAQTSGTPSQAAPKKGMPIGETGTMNKGTTGASSRPSGGDASTSGAGPAAGVNSTGNAKEPGAVKDGANGR